MLAFLKDFAYHMMTLIPKALFELALLGVFVVLTALRYAHQQLDKNAQPALVRALPLAPVLCPVRDRAISGASDRSFNSDAAEELFASHRHKWR